MRDRDEDQVMISPDWVCHERRHPQAQMLALDGENRTLCMVCTLIHRRGGDDAVEGARAEREVEIAWLSGRSGGHGLKPEPGMQ